VAYETPPPVPPRRRVARLVWWATGFAAIGLFLAGAAAYTMVAVAGKGGHAGFEAWARRLRVATAVAVVANVLAAAIASRPNRPA
jgi:hypothetical protein